MVEQTRLQRQIERDTAKALREAEKAAKKDAVEARRKLAANTKAVAAAEYTERVQIRKDVPVVPGSRTARRNARFF